MAFDLNGFLSASKRHSVMLSLTATAFLCALDILSGPGYRMTFPYILPLMVVVFYSSPVWAIVNALMAVSIRLVTDVMAIGSLRLSFAWNAVATLATYIIVIFLMDRFRRAKEVEREKWVLESSVEALRKSVAEKDLIVREVHHRMKNDMAALVSLIGVAEANEGSELVEALRNKIETYGLLYEKLCYEEGDQKTTDLLGYLRDLVRLLAANPGVGDRSIEFSFEGERTIVPAIAATYVGLIINELVSNSIKHAFSEGRGEIRIGLERKGEYLELSYRDDGPGYDYEHASREGHIGKMLIETFVEQLKGELSYSRDSGSVFLLRLRIGEPDRDRESEVLRVNHPPPASQAGPR